ncbi:hypothetical protein L7F22_025582 [Adiantum nelumboides]|nr:hypothetical protein [Adiantum nelumboides]
MASRRYERDYNAFGEEEGGMEQSQVEEEEDDWGLFSSSSPSSSTPAPPVPSTSKVRPPTTTLPSSPECSMNDDSSTDGESLETARVKRRATGSLQHRADSREFQATTALQRRIMIKELQAKTQQECLALCCSLLPLQQKWRQVRVFLNHAFSRPLSVFSGKCEGRYKA